MAQVRPWLQVGVVASFVALASACGGGGGASVPSPTPSPTPTPTPVPAPTPTPSPPPTPAPAPVPANASFPGELTTPYPTINNLTVEWVLNGDANADSKVQVRYRVAGQSTWLQAMPLRRIGAGSNAGFSWAARHSGSVFNLQPGTTYELELSLEDPDGGSLTRTTTVSTRALPQVMANAPVKAATPTTLAAVLAAAQPGDVVELGAGSYSGFTVGVDGAPGKPLVIRARSGAVINGEVGLFFRNHVWLDGLKVNGRIRFNGSNHTSITHCEVNASASVGNGDGIVTYLRAENAYIADNTVTGTTVWAESSLGVSGNNLGEGILVTGPGHVIMNKRVSGFRDNISLLEGSEAVDQYSIDIVANDLSVAADDAIEADYCQHNCRIMGNRITDSFVGLSAQPSLGGPTYFIRNTLYNLSYSAFKLHNGSNGDVLLHNTVVKGGDAFATYAGAPVRNLYSRNNLLIGGPGGVFGGYSNGSGRALSFFDLEVSSANMNYDAMGVVGSPMEGFFGSQRFTGLAQLRSATTEKNAVQVDLSVFAAAVTLPTAAMVRHTPPDLRLQAGAAAVDVGAVLPNINDGFAGAAPDAGALELGAALPLVGPRP